MTAAASNPPTPHSGHWKAYVTQTQATHPPLTLSVAARQQGRLWHKTSTNRTADRRIFIGVKYLPRQTFPFVTFPIH